MVIRLPAVRSPSGVRRPPFTYTSTCCTLVYSHPPWQQRTTIHTPILTLVRRGREPDSHKCRSLPIPLSSLYWTVCLTSTIRSSSLRSKCQIRLRLRPTPLSSAQHTTRAYVSNAKSTTTISTTCTNSCGEHRQKLFLHHPTSNLLRNERK